MKTLTNTVRLAAGALALAIGMAAPAAAQPGFGFGQPGDFDRRGGPGGRPGGGPLGGLLALHPDLPLAALNLTDAQREQVRTIMQSHRDEGRAIAQKAHAALESLRKAGEGTVDEGAISQQSQALGAVIGEAAVLRAKVRAEVFAILTPEQQAEATKIAEQRRTRTQQRRQQRQEPGQQG